MKTDLWQKSHVVTILTILAGLALIIITRIYGIGDWAYYSDELYTVGTAKKGITNAILGFKPGYYVSTAVIFELFGVSEFTARIASALFGIAGIIVLYFWVRRIFGVRTAIYSSILLIFHGWHLYHSQFARFYSAVFLFGLIAYFLHLESFRKGDLRILIGALLVTIVAVLFHTSAIGIFVSCTVFAGFILISGNSSITAQTRRLAKIYLSLAVIGAVIVIPFLLKMLGDWQSLEQSWGYGPFNQALQLAKYISIPIFAIGMLALLPLIKERPLEGWFFGINIIVPVTLLVVASSFTTVRPDYIIYVLSLFVIMVGYLSAEIEGRTSNWFSGGKVLILVLWLGLLPEFVSHYTSKMTLDIREVVEYVERHYQEGDKVLPMVVGFDTYSKLDGEDLPRSAYRTDINWSEKLDRYKYQDGRIWIITPWRREQFATNLRTWLAENTSLVWQKHSKRYDYTLEGYQIFLEYECDLPPKKRTRC